MSLSSHSGFQGESRERADAIRFDCACKLDSWGSASLELSGELDGAVCKEFEARLEEAQRASAVVTLDLRRLTFMDGAGYTALLFASRGAKPEARLILAGCGGQVKRLLDLLGLPEKVEFEGCPRPFTVRSERLVSSRIGSGSAVGA